MAPLMALIVLLFILGCTAAYMLPSIRRHWREIEGGEAGPDVLRLQQAIDDLSARLVLVEEETEFYRKLRSPEDRPQIEPGPED